MSRPRDAMSREEAEQFITALREVLGLGPIRGEREVPDVERFGGVFFEDPVEILSRRARKQAGV